GRHAICSGDWSSDVCSSDLERLAQPPPGNTTLTVVVTDQALDARSLRQLAAQVHASMARAIQPFHALVDGDVLFAATTAEAETAVGRASCRESVEGRGVGAA